MYPSKADVSTDSLSIKFYIISSVMHALWLVLTYDPLEDRRTDEVIIKTFFPFILILYYIKQIDSKLPCVCSVIDHRGRQNVVRTSVAHEVALRLVCHFFGLIRLQFKILIGLSGVESVFNHTSDQENRKTAKRESDLLITDRIVNYRQNWTTRSPVTN